MNGGLTGFRKPSRSGFRCGWMQETTPCSNACLPVFMATDSQTSASIKQKQVDFPLVQMGTHP